MPRNKIARNSSARNNRAFGLNWALREARRQRSRTILAMLLIGFPLMIAAFAAVLIPSSIATTQDHLDAELGPQAECRVERLISGSASSTEIADAEQQVRDVLGSSTQSHNYLRVNDVRVPDIAARSHTLLQVDFSDEVLREWMPLREGTAPGQPGEAVIGAGLAKALRKGVGEQFDMQFATGTHSLTISGIAQPEPISWEKNEAVVIDPASVLPALAAELASQDLLLNQLVVTDRPAEVADVIALETNVGQPTCRAVQLSFDDSGSGADVNTMVILGALGAVVIVEIILLVGPAFLVGARKNVRQLALVAANGGTPATLRRLTLLRNGVLGLIAGLVGVAVGLLAAVGTYIYSDLTDRSIFITLRVTWWLLAVFVLLGVLVSVAASWLPAREASRIQVVQALRGQRSQARARKSIWVLGLVMVAAGLGLGLYGTMTQSSGMMVLGIVGVLLGLVASSGMIIQLLGGLARFAGFSLRFALRDATRNRTRTAGAVVAIIAASAALVAWTAYDSSATIRDEQLLRLPAAVGYASVTYAYSFDPQQSISPNEQTARLEELAPRLEADLSRYLADVELVPIYEAVTDPDRQISTSYYDDLLHQPDAIYFAAPPQNQCQDGEWDWADFHENEKLFRDDPRCADFFGTSILYTIGSGAGVGSGVLVDDGTLFSRLNSRYGSDQIAEVLASGTSVVTDPYLVDDQRQLTLHLVTGDTTESIEESKVPGAYAAGYTGNHAEGVLHPAALEQLGWSQALIGYLVINSGPVVGMQATSVHALNYEWFDDGIEFQVEVFQELANTSPAALAYLTAALILLVLGVSSISVSLALTDARADLATLGAVGARPQVRRRIAAAYGLIIAGTGSVLGGVGGLAGAAVFVSAQKHQYEFADDTWELIINWPHLALVVLGVPATVTALMWLVGGGKLPAVRRLE